MYAEDFNTPAATSQPAKRRRIDNDDAVSDEDKNLASLLVGLSQSDGGPSSSAAAATATAGEVKKQKESPPSTAVNFKKLTEYSPSTDHPQPAAQNNCYMCGVCGRTFPSYQALGGHKSSHRDKPAAAAASQKRKTLASTPTACSGPITGGRLHKCGDCGKNFPSGQALGGHKRKHYQGVIIGRGDVGAKIGGNITSEIDGSGGSSGVTSSGGGASSHSNGDAAPVRWNFDLNLPPPVDLDLSL